MENLRKKGLTALKIVFSALLLYLVFDRIPFREVWGTVKNALVGYLLLALLFFLLSKILAAFRLNAYFRQVGIPLTHASNLKLYLLGMFYNLFLPGGIGGDAYKGYALRKAFGHPVRRLVAVLLLDRVSGMYLLFAYSVALLWWTAPGPLADYTWALALLLPLSLVAYLWGHRRFFTDLHPVFWNSLGYSAGVQLAQLATAYCILLALQIPADPLPYLLLFLVSSIVAVLPITLGGIGSRELVFYYGALWFQLEEQSAVAISMAFFLITALVSLAGIIYHFRKPELHLRRE
ncbi:lysylphosphatidylglycerol synthase transmembrane domain-containing protein [Robiginitalea sp. M366]|uniref:lysylphosphatidylglycerol synthase transmembrane domain-containing protein n=1 Tax=Robiginitalea aestuariiviva TaxID=3036903 RepID=UPI00240CFC9A|nr:lysylphosphatidylglycerol synthase transmembrane domain-containing protein [Robiginitalea aestuariiviva]MDG1572382.1 lysylphosphatidylglycerol synthase transmembrane domain-containing protein [Robiginitalea aestuariiviva]